MEQFEQLLTCAICLDRYNNPKLLPCQHSFCMEPCMDGLVDYVRRQVKCPECRAEHRIPYQGVQGFPTNVTLQRFLELHIEITGELPDPTSGQIMERCGVCSEKAYCCPCVHCDKKICPDCKGAHMDILRREIARINNQVRRALHRLQDALGMVEKNTMSLQVNCASVAEEVDEIYRRLAKALKDRTEYLRVEVDRYLCTELRNLGNLKEGLETEISNITSNCDLADKHMTDSVEWDDCELMDAKEIFLKTVEFIRNFEYENQDYNRRVRFAMAHDPNQLVLHVAGYGELNINMPTSIMPANSNSSLLQPPGGGPGLMRSKSDHRLATQFRQQEERGGYGGDGDNSEPLGGRKFGERYGNRSSGQVGYEAPTSRYGRTTTTAEYPEFESPYDSDRPKRSSGYRSRFARHTDDGGSDNDQGGGRSVRFTGTEREKEVKVRERVLDTEDVAKGPLSGISRLYDSPRVMKRLQESEKVKKEPAPAPPKPTVQIKAMAAVGVPVKKVSTSRQVSEEDEIAKIKRQNKSGTSTEAAAPPSPTTRTPVPVPVPEVEPEVASSDESEEETEAVASLQQRKSTPAKTTGSTAGSTAASRRSSASSDVTPHKKAVRSASSDSSTSSESSTASSKVAHTGAAFTTEEVKKNLLARGSIDKGTPTETTPTPSSGPSTPPTRSRIGSASTTETTPPTKQPFQSRFLGAGRPTPPATVEKKEETETSSEEESSSDEEESEEEVPKKSTAASKMEKTDIGPLLARSAQARDSAEGSRKNSRDETAMSDYKSRYGSPSSTTNTNSSRYGTAAKPEPEPARSRYGTYGKEEVKEPPKYGRARIEEETPRYQSRFLNKSKSSAALSPEEEVEASLNKKYGPDGDMAKKLEDTRYPSGRTRYAALKDRRSRLSRSKSSHNFGGEDGDEEDPSAMPASYQASRYGPGSAATSSSDLARSRSTHALKSGEASPERAGSGGSTGEKDGAALSSWARYLKNKYGNRSASKDSPTTTAPPSAASSSASRRLSMGLPLRNSLDSSDDDQKNMPGSPTSPTAAQAGFAVGTSPRSQYLQKRRQQFKIGERGSEAGCFTWPRGIAVGPDNTIVVADSSNHRVQVFDSQGIFVKEFGTYGNGQGEFDCLAGVAVNRIGQFIIADRYNHRIQVLDPSGRFLRAFGSQGTADGRFNYPWGITTDALGFIYVCDKENHRVQVFQSDGMFVGKFGTCGSKPGQLEHPHYIAVSSTNRVIVSDSNNHRIQIFDVNGRVLTTFGTEGSEEGQFKFPRGVAVDDQGYICVADSGNNRIQIFHPDGTFLRAFGCWGSGDGEFKGLEGVAVMSNGNILVCDRENHRVQVF